MVELCGYDQNSLVNNACFEELTSIIEDILSIRKGLFVLFLKVL